MDRTSIIRILFMIPIYATVSFLSYLYYRHAIYFEVLRDCYEAFALASFFTLLCHYIASSLHDQKEYFRTLQPMNWIWPLSWMQICTGGQDKGFLRRPQSGLTWFNVRCCNLYCWDVLLTCPRLFGLVFSNIVSSAFYSPSCLLSRNSVADTARPLLTPYSLTSGFCFLKVHP